MLKKAVIVGASGLVGNELLHILLNANFYDEVLILVRKELPVQHTKLIQLIIDFNKLDDYSASINGHALFCCLGTTRSKTPDEKQYRVIDHDYPVKLALIAGRSQMEQYHFVSALGADAKSSNFYLKLKGETENDIERIGIKTLHIYRPSLLTGARQEYRLAERIATTVMKIINPVLLGPLKKYRSIEATTVAQAMYKQSLNFQEGVFIYQSDHIQQLA